MLYIQEDGLVDPDCISASQDLREWPTDATCDFRHVRFETPRRVSFHGLTLRPHWFLNLDPREFEFINVKWVGQLSRRFIDIEIGELRKREELERKEAADRIAQRIRDLESFGDWHSTKTDQGRRLQSRRHDSPETRSAIANRDRLVCRSSRNNLRTDPSGAIRSRCPAALHALTRTRATE